MRDSPERILHRNLSQLINQINDGLVTDFAKLSKEVKRITKNYEHNLDHLYNKKR